MKLYSQYAIFHSFRVPLDRIDSQYALPVVEGD